MFKFGGWKASLNFSGSARRKEVYENGPELSVGGAYRAHKEDSFGRNSISEPPKKLTPSMVILPPSNDKLKTSKSANHLSDQHNLPPQLRKSENDVSTDPRGGTSSNLDSSTSHKNTKHKSSKEDKKNEKEQKNAEKKRIAEQKKQEKAKQEQEKKDKLRIQQDKKITEQQAKDVKERKVKSKKKAPPGLPQAPVPTTLVPPASGSTQPAQRAPTASSTVPQAPVPMQPAQRTPYSTNTLESSISRTSGPPPYTETRPPEKRPNNNDNTGNTSFSKPIENSSWDLISEHRSQMSRNPVASGSSSKQMVMDLQFSFDKAQGNDRDNSEV